MSAGPKFSQRTPVDITERRTYPCELSDARW